MSKFFNLCETGFHNGLGTQ